jgi:signal peptidase I
LGCELTVDVVRNFGEVRLKVTGASMLPYVWPGDVVTIQRRDATDLRPGQIVLYRRDGKLIAHRVKLKLGDHLITQGDSLPHCDSPVSASEVIGQLVDIHRRGRRISPEPLFWQRAISPILRHSDFCTRMTLRIGRRLQLLRKMELLWAS